MNHMQFTTELKAISQPRSNEGTRYSITMERDLLAQIDTIADLCRSSRFDIMLAAFCVLLERYTQKTDLEAASFRNSSPQGEDESVEFFVDTVNLRKNLDLKHNFLSFVENLRDTLVVGKVKHNLSVDLFTHEDILEIRFDYASKIFDHALMVDFARNYLGTLRYIMAHLEYPIGQYDINFRDPTSPNRVWDASIQEKTIVDVFQGLLNSADDRRILFFEDKDLSSKDFWDLVLRKAKNLRHSFKIHFKRDLAAGECIGLSSQRCLDTLSDIVAILFAGASFVPYDPNGPQDRVTYTLQDSQALARIEHGIVFFGDNLDRVVLSKITTDEISKATLPKIDPNQLAYMIYTSGTSGQPKGVKISHGALLSYFTWFGSLEFKDSVQRCDFSTNLTFDAAITTTLVALGHEFSIYTCSDAIKQSPRAFLKYLANKQIDLCKCTPSYFRLLLHEAQQAQALCSPQLKWLIGGEEMNSRNTAAWLMLYPTHVFYNSYGPTETTVTCSKFRIDQANISRFPDRIPIEGQSRSTLFQVLDHDMRPVPHGVRGELYISGPVLADGYQNKPIETDLAFLPLANGTRWYKTGDQVVTYPDGMVEYVGRLDEQVKVRGVRIELEEIRQVVCSHKKVLDAKVLVHTLDGFPQLFAFVTPKEAHYSETILVESIQSHLFKKLSAASTPQHFVILEKMPFNPSGKLDLQALRNILDGRTFGQGKMLASTPLELSILQVWREFLPPGKIGTNSNFFNLGGDSLIAMQVMDQINRYLNSDLPGHLIFQQPTIRELAQAIEAQHKVVNLYNFNAAEDRPALCLIHPATGLAQCYQGLTPSLKEYDFYALNNDRFAEVDHPYESIEDMASAYLKVLLERRPHGPHIIGGFCTGGAVAIEMARQMQEQGIKPLALILIDSFKLEDTSTKEQREAYNTNQLQLSGLDQLSYLARKINRQLEHNRDLVVKYQPASYDGNCLFIRCHRIEREDVNYTQASKLSTQLNGWASALRSAHLQTISVDASHNTIFRDDTSVQFVASHIKTYLDQLCHESVLC